MDTILGATIKTNKQNNGRTPDKGKTKVTLIVVTFKNDNNHIILFNR